MRRRQWIWIVPVLLLAGCSKSSAPEQAVAPAPPAEPPAAAQTASPAPGAQRPVAAVSPLGSNDVARRASPAAPAAPAEAARLTIPAGTKLVVRLDSALSTKENDAGDRFTATLEE